MSTELAVATERGQSMAELMVYQLHLHKSTLPRSHV